MKNPLKKLEQGERALFYQTEIIRHNLPPKIKTIFFHRIIFLGVTASRSILHGLLPFLSKHYDTFIPIQLQQLVLSIQHIANMILLLLPSQIHRIFFPLLPLFILHIRNRGDPQLILVNRILLAQVIQHNPFIFLPPKPFTRLDFW